VPSIRLDELSPFGRAALNLDREFAALAEVGEQMATADLGSDKGLDEGLKILNRAAAHGESLAAAMQEFSAALQEARDKAEAATRIVAERAQLIQSRREAEEELQQKLGRLQEEVKAAGAGLSGSDAPAKGPLSDEDKRRIAAELERFQAPMARFVEAARAVKAEAAASNYKRVERQADSMIDSLQASLRKIAAAIAPK
jgi:hypothetical protein